MKVYVLTEGSYSSYGIVGVTLDYEQAQKVTELHPFLTIEEYDTEAVRIESLEEYPLWEVSSLGVVHSEQPLYYSGAPDMSVREFYVPAFLWKSTTWSGLTLDESTEIVDGKIHEYRVLVRAKDRETAKRIGLDKIAEYKYHKVEESNDG